MFLLTPVFGSLLAAWFGLPRLARSELMMASRLSQLAGVYIEALAKTPATSSAVGPGADPAQQVRSQETSVRARRRCMPPALTHSPTHSLTH